MTRPAAGRAGGRAADRGRLPRWAGPVLAGALVVGTAAPVLAAPPVGPAPAVLPGGAPLPARAPSADNDADAARPLDIEVARLEPRTITDGSTVTVSGTMTNTGASTLRDLEVRLQRGNVLTTRAELVADDADPDPATTVAGAFSPVPGQVPPGESLSFTYEVPAERLQLAAEGVYPALVNVNATDDEGQRRRVGELSTYLVRRVADPDERTSVAWLWPVVADTSRRADGGFADDELARSIAPGGRLDRVLAVLERLPRTSPDRPPGTPTPTPRDPAAGDPAPTPAQTPALPVTMAVDPALVEELTVMAAGPYAVDDRAGAGQGTEAAADFLDRLRALAAVHPVLALPYGDVDADSLSAVGLEDVVLRSLPGTAAGTAADPAGAPRPADPPPVDPPAEEAPAGTPPASVTEPSGSADPAAADATGTPPAGTGEPADEAPGVPAPAEELGVPAGAGARILTDALGVQPRTDTAWAAGGAFRSDTVATLQEGGVERLVVEPGGLTRGSRAVGLPGGTASVHTTVETPAGGLEVLVADTGLGVLADAAEDRPGGPRLAEQRYLAELALLGQQAPAGSTPTVLVAPPREVEAGPDGVGAMMADTAGLGWLEPVSLDSLLDTPPTATGALTDPAGAVLLDRAGLRQVVAAEQLRDDLAEAVVENPDQALQAYDAAIARTSSVTLRDDPAEFRAAAGDLREELDRLLARVGLVVPAEGTYSLASSDAPLVLTVQNDLPFAVNVLLDLGTRGRRGITIEDIGPQLLAPGERTTLRVPTQVRQSGGFAVTARLTTPGGTPLGDPVRLQVRSTAYGPISLMITFGAAALLGLLFLRRLVLFVVRRRRAAAAAGTPEDLGLSTPPTRSPV